MTRQPQREIHQQMLSQRPTRTRSPISLQMAWDLSRQGQGCMRHGEGKDSADLLGAKTYTNTWVRVSAQPTALCRNTSACTGADAFIQHSNPARRRKVAGGGSFPPPPPLAQFPAGQHLLLHLLGHKGKDRTSQPRDTYINDDTFVKQALLLGGHDKIVGAVLVVDNVLKVDPCKEKRAWTQCYSLSVSVPHRLTSHYLPAYTHVRQVFKARKAGKDKPYPTPHG